MNLSPDQHKQLKAAIANLMNATDAVTLLLGYIPNITISDPTVGSIIQELTLDKIRLERLGLTEFDRQKLIRLSHATIVPAPPPPEKLPQAAPPPPFDKMIDT